MLSKTFKDNGRPDGTQGRIAIPVSGDAAQPKKTAMQLVVATGFDALDAGTLDECWRQQPGTTAYCTELTLGELKFALATANKERSPENREALINKIHGRRREADAR